MISYARCAGLYKSDSFLYNRDMNNYYLNDISRPPFVDFHIERATVNGDFEVHTHEFCEIFFVLSGAGIHIAGDAEHRLRKGELFAVKGREKHGFRECVQLNIVNVMFRVSPVTAQQCMGLPGFWVLFLHEQRFGSISHVALSGDGFERVQDWCRQMLDEYTAGAPGSVAICHAVLTQLMVFLARSCQRIPQNTALPDFRLAEALVYLQRNYMKPLELDELAALVGFSPRHFSRLFQELYHDSPMRYLTQVRLAHARRLLAHTGYTVTEVAGMCGFADGNYFSRIFKRDTGVTPLQWRSRARAGTGEVPAPTE